MGWFDEQIKQRKKLDNQLYEDSFFDIANIILGERTTESTENGTAVQQAIDEIMTYYHLRPAEIPENISTDDEKLDYCLNLHGFMKRRIILEKSWFSDAYGPVFAFKKNGEPVALIPNKFMGYHFTDRKTGKKILISRKNADIFRNEAYCFYRPFPRKEMSFIDLLAYMQKCISLNDFLFFVSTVFVAVSAGMFIPNIVRALTGSVVSSKNEQLFFSLSLCIFFTIASKQIYEAISGILSARIKTKTAVGLQAAVMMRILSLPATFFRKHTTGELSSRSSALSLLCELILSMFFETGIPAVMSLMYIIELFIFTPKLAPAALSVLLVNTVFSGLVSFIQIISARKQAVSKSSEASVGYSMINGIQKIKLSGAEKRFFAKWLKYYAQNARDSYILPSLVRFSKVITMAVNLTGNIIICFIAVESGVRQSDYFAFAAVCGILSGAFGTISNIASSVGKIRSLFETAEPFLKTQPEITDNKEIVTELHGNIELNSVYFRYSEDSPYIINNLSVKINSGEYVAIVGRTGCGKSTLMRLLLGFEKPQKGSVYYDGKDMNNLDLSSLRRKIGSVTQNSGLFQGDIYSNITISAPNLTVTDAWEAAEKAGIADDIRSMPMGMNTFVSEGQGTISGGQKQRIIIARAIAPKPKILMFDEATSALDNKTQKKVSQSLDEMGCTRIVIAHRLSTIKNCDRILVFGNGRIIEDGSYEQLIAKGGYFAKLIERQRVRK